jgi:small subunit ribosomal protein S16
VVAKSTAGRNGAFVETLGQYDPVVKPALININEERALYWLNEGAQPTETTAYLLNKVGILPRFFEARPAAKKNYSFLDKRTASISMPSAVTAEIAPEPVVAAQVPEPAPEPIAEPPVEASVDLEPASQGTAAESVDSVAEATPAPSSEETEAVDPEPQAAPAEV